MRVFRVVVMVVRLTKRNENEEVVVNPHSGSNNSYQMLVGDAAPYQRLPQLYHIQALAK